MSGHASAVRAMLDAGVDVNKSDKYGITALLSASECGMAAIRRAPPRARGSADVNKGDGRGETALVTATLIAAADVRLYPTLSPFSFLTLSASSNTANTSPLTKSLYDHVHEVVLVVDPRQEVRGLAPLLVQASPLHVPQRKGLRLPREEGAVLHDGGLLDLPVREDPPRDGGRGIEPHMM